MRNWLHDTISPILQALPPRRPTPADWPAYVMPQTPPASSAAFSHAAMQPPFSPADATRAPPQRPLAASERGTAARVTRGAVAGIAVAAMILLAAIALVVYLFERRQRKAARAANIKHVEMLAGGVFPGAAGGANACMRAGGFGTAEEAHLHQLRVAKVMRHLDTYRGGDVLLLRQYELLSRDLSAVGGALSWWRRRHCTLYQCMQYVVCTCECDLSA